MMNDSTRKLNDMARRLKRNDGQMTRLSFDDIWILPTDFPVFNELLAEIRTSPYRHNIISVRMPRTMPVAIGKEHYLTLLSHISNLPLLEEFVVSDTTGLYRLARDSTSYIHSLSPRGRLSVKRLDLQSGCMILDADMPSVVAIIEASDSLEEFSADIETRFAHTALSFIGAFSALPRLRKLSVTVPKAFCHQVWCASRHAPAPVIDDDLLGCFLRNKSLQELFLYNFRLGDNVLHVLAHALLDESLSLTSIEIPGYRNADLSKESELINALLNNTKIRSLKLVSNSVQQTSPHLALFQCKLDVLCELNREGKGKIVGDPNAPIEDIIRLMNIAQDHPDLLMSILVQVPRLFQMHHLPSRGPNEKELTASLASVCR